MLAGSQTFGQSPQSLIDAGQVTHGVCCGTATATEAGPPALPVVDAAGPLWPRRSVTFASGAAGAGDLASVVGLNDLPVSRRGGGSDGSGS